MIKPASLEEEYFVVLTLKGKVLRLGKRIQKMLAEHYKIYNGDNYPVLHLTIDRIDKNKLKEADKTLKDIVKDFKAIQIRIDELNCMKISQDNNLLVIDVEDTKSLLNSAKIIHQNLYKKNISTIDNYKDWNFHITIINNSFAVNPISEEDFSDICYLLEDFTVPYTSYANNLEIWQASLDPNDRVLKKYKLPDREENDEQ